VDEGVRLGVRGLAQVLGPRGAGHPAEHMAELTEQGVRIDCAAPDVERLGFEPDALETNAHVAPLQRLADLAANGWRLVPT